MALILSDHRRIVGRILKFRKFNTSHCTRIISRPEFGSIHETYPAMIFFNNFFDNRKTKAAALALAGEVRFKKPRTGLGADAGSAIEHR